MRLTSMECHACGKGPGIMEWIRGDVSGAGYGEWCHPMRAFHRAGYIMNHENRTRCDRLYLQLFGHPLPEAGGFICPRCQQLMIEELPGLWEADGDDDSTPPPRCDW